MLNTSSPVHLRPPHQRARNIVTGTMFIIAAIGWLIINDQRRKASIAISDTIINWPQHPRRFLGTSWQWARNRIFDPWGKYRRKLTSQAHGDVLEIGVGGWPNLRYYPQITSLVGTETDRRLALTARRTVRRHLPAALLVVTNGSLLPFGDQTFDTIVTSLSLCSVSDPDTMVQEITRVLRPDGTLIFLEHVRSMDPTIARLQDYLTPLWHRITFGCHLNRNTMAILQRHGLDPLVVLPLRGAWGPIRPTLMGIAHISRDSVFDQKSHLKTIEE